VVLLADEVRLTRDAMRYGFAVGKVRVLERRVLDRAAYERLLDARSFSEQKRLLSDTLYGRFIEPAKTAEDVERALDDALEEAYGFLGKAALPEPVTRYFRLRYDFANLKAVGKARMLGAPLEGLLVGHGTVPSEAFEGDLSRLPDPFATLGSILPAEPPAADSEEASLAIDAVVDAAMFAELLRTAKEARSAFLVQLAALAIDIANIKTLVRGRRAGMDGDTLRGLLIEGGTVDPVALSPLADLHAEEISGALSRFATLKRLASKPLHDPARLDLALDAVATAALRGARMGQVGPEPVISYVFERARPRQHRCACSCSAGCQVSMTPR
jgi:V/A-type H+-transporting ATPase subunit C